MIKSLKKGRTKEKDERNRKGKKKKTKRRAKRRKGQVSESEGLGRMRAWGCVWYFRLFLR